MQKLNEIRAQKTEYQEGFWNVNSVMLGGLGRDPNIEGELTLSPYYARGHTF